MSVDLDPTRRRCRVRAESDPRPSARGLRFAAVAVAAMIAFLLGSFRPTGGGGIAASCRRPAASSSSTSPRASRPIRTRASPRRSNGSSDSKRLVRPDPVLRHRVSGAAAEHAGRGSSTPLLRFFDVPAETSPGALPQAPRSPWTDAFGAGTRISTGLSLALDVIRKEQAAAPGGAPRQRPRRRQRRCRPRQPDGDRLPPRGHPAARRRAQRRRRRTWRSSAGSWQGRARSSRRRSRPSEASGSSGSVDLRLVALARARGSRPRRLPAPRRASALEDIVSVWRIAPRHRRARARRRRARAGSRHPRLAGRIERGDARFAAQPAAARWDARTWLPGDPAPRRALAPRRPRGSRRRAGVRRRDGGADGIRRRAPEGADPRARRAGALRRARDRIARTGVAGRQPARHPRRHRRQRVGRGVSDRRAAETFEAAIRADPTNEDAKYNLELLLRRIKVVGSREGAGGSSGDFGDSLTGAGAGLPGSGY